MKKKRTTYAGSFKPYQDGTKSKVPSQIYNAAVNNAKSNAEYNEKDKDQQTSSNMNTSRSISLNKQENKPPTVIKAQPQNSTFKAKNPFGCTYFGQGFFKASVVESKPNPSPVNPNKSSAHKQSRINSMHKTANYWNVPNKSKHMPKGSGVSEYTSENKRKADCIPVYPNYTIAGYLPAIDQKVIQFSENQEVETSDAYIKYVTHTKKSRQNTMMYTRQKEGEQGQILPLERKPNHMVPEDPNAGIRAFNWEGIHFEVSPKRDGSSDSAQNMKDYQNDMNLMCYNFNGLTNQQIRNASESPNPDSIPDIPTKKIISIFNKTSNNFGNSWKLSKNNNHMGSFRKSNSKHKSNIPFDKIEEEPEGIPQKPYNITPREFPQEGDFKIRLENEARKTIERPNEHTEDPQNSSRRKKSPPPLTPITNNSIFLRFNTK